MPAVDGPKELVDVTSEAQLDLLGCEWAETSSLAFPQQKLQLQPSPQGFSIYSFPVQSLPCLSSKYLSSRNKAIQPFSCLYYSRGIGYPLRNRNMPLGQTAWCTCPTHCRIVRGQRTARPFLLILCIYACPVKLFLNLDHKMLWYSPLSTSPHKQDRNVQGCRPSDGSLYKVLKGSMQEGHPFF